jgi:hypothetical protein
MLPFGALAEEPMGGLLPLVATVAPTEHPYAILNFAPGANQEAILGALSKHFERNLFPETVTLNIQSPQGRQFHYEYVQRLTTPWVDGFVRMGNDSYEEITVDLATEVLGGRVLAIHRTIVMTENDRPSAEAIFGQLIKTYGQPSAMVTGSHESELLYAYGNDGFISDLKQLEDTMHPVIANQPRTASISRYGSYFHEDVPCIGAIGRNAFYAFQMPRRDDTLASCDAALRVHVRASGVKTMIRFDLMDYRLIRANREETDHQIMDLLEQEQSPSRIKL